MEKKKDHKIKIVSWNVNGIRAAYKRGLLDFIRKKDADLYCLQETKANKGQLEERLLNIDGYDNYFSSPVKKGYSGVCIYSKLKPERKIFDTGNKRFDDEGRLAGLVFRKVILLNVYFPNGGASEERLDYKLEFYDFFLDLINGYRDSGKSIIFCGDVNTAHTEIDLARPAANKNNTGFLPRERAWIDSVISSGYMDIFRHFDSRPHKYTWWDYKTRARDRNVGWRLDYFFVSEDLKDVVDNAYIMSDIMGSDHCPVALELPFKVFQ